MMTPNELGQVEKRLERLFAHHIDEFAKTFVSKADFVKLAAQVDMHNDAYQDYLKFKRWIFRIGIATLISSAVSPHLGWLLKMLKMLLG